MILHDHFHIFAYVGEDSGLMQYIAFQCSSAIVEDVSGYLSKSRRKIRKDTGQIPVTLDFLSIRDLFRLLSETSFRTTWAFDKPFWNADEATEESHLRIMSHLNKVLFTDPTLATRLAYFTNPELIIRSLQTAGLWRCLNEKDKVVLKTMPWGDAKNPDQQILTVVTDALMDARNCDKAQTQKFIDEVEEVRIPKAVKSMAKERGLSAYCCGQQAV